MQLNLLPISRMEMLVQVLISWLTTEIPDLYL
jgi:hypothetical protein